MKRLISLLILTLSLGISSHLYAADDHDHANHKGEHKNHKGHKDHKDHKGHKHGDKAVKRTVGAGEKMHNNKCKTCHDDSVYSRKDRMVNSMPALINQVNNCMRSAAKANWTPKQTSAVVNYLNTRYYKF